MNEKDSNDIGPLKELLIIDNDEDNTGDSAETEEDPRCRRRPSVKFSSNSVATSEHKAKQALAKHEFICSNAFYIIPKSGAYHLRRDIHKTTDDPDELPDAAKCLIPPDSVFLRLWDTLIFVALLYCLTIGALRSSFYYYNTAEDRADLFANVLFMIDVLLQFFCPYELDTVPPSLECRHSRIAFHYLRTWFVIDVITAIPFGLIESGSGTVSEIAKAPKTLRILKILRILKLFRLRKVGTVLNALMHSTDVHPAKARVMMLVGFMLLCLHLLSCIWYLIGQLDEEDNWIINYYEGPPTGVAVVDLYFTCLYWTVTTLATVGYGDVVARSTYEKAFSMFAELCGVSLFAYVSGSLSSMLIAEDVENQSFRYRMSALEHHTKQMQTPAKLTNKIIRIMAPQWERKAKNEIDLKDLIPDAGLKKELAFSFWSELIKKCDFLRTLSGGCPGFVTALCGELQSMDLRAGELLATKGTVFNYWYILAEGDCLIYPSEHRHKQKSRGLFANGLNAMGFGKRPEDEEEEHEQGMKPPEQRHAPHLLEDPDEDSSCEEGDNKENERGGHKESSAPLIGNNGIHIPEKIFQHRPFDVFASSPTPLADNDWIGLFLAGDPAGPPLQIKPVRKSHRGHAYDRVWRFTVAHGEIGETYEFRVYSSKDVPLHTSLKLRQRYRVPNTESATALLSSPPFPLFAEKAYGLDVALRNMRKRVLPPTQHLCAGDSFGEVSGFLLGYWPYTVRCVTSCKLFALPKPRFITILENLPPQSVAYKRAFDFAVDELKRLQEDGIVSEQIPVPSKPLPVAQLKKLMNNVASGDVPAYIMNSRFEACESISGDSIHSGPPGGHAGGMFHLARHRVNAAPNHTDSLHPPASTHSGQRDDTRHHTLPADSEIQHTNHPHLAHGPHPQNNDASPHLDKQQPDDGQFPKITVTPPGQQTSHHSPNAHDFSPPSRPSRSGTHSNNSSEQARTQNTAAHSNIVSPDMFSALLFEMQQLRKEVHAGQAKHEELLAELQSRSPHRFVSPIHLGDT